MDEGESQLLPASHPLPPARPRAVLPPVFSRAWEATSLPRHAQYRTTTRKDLRGCSLCAMAAALSAEWRTRYKCAHLRAHANVRACMHGPGALSPSPLSVHGQPSLHAHMAAHAQNPYSCATVHARTRMRTHA